MRRHPGIFSPPFPMGGKRVCGAPPAYFGNPPSPKGAAAAERRIRHRRLARRARRKETSARRHMWHRKKKAGIWAKSGLLSPSCLPRPRVAAATRKLGVKPRGCAPRAAVTPKRGHGALLAWMRGRVAPCLLLPWAAGCLVGLGIWGWGYGVGVLGLGSWGWGVPKCGLRCQEGAKPWK